MLLYKWCKKCGMDKGAGIRMEGHKSSFCLIILKSTKLTEKGYWVENVSLFSTTFAQTSSL
jgi:hypothetical protein